MGIKGLNAIEPVGGAPSNASRTTVSDFRSSSSNLGSGAMSVSEAVSRLQQHINSLSEDSQFSVDYLSGLDVVTVRDTNTGEVIRQIPSAEAVRLAQLLRNGDMSGATAFVDIKV